MCILTPLARHSLQHKHKRTVGSEVRVQPFPTARDDSKLATRVHSLHHSVRDLKQEVATVRSDHAISLSDFQHSMMVTSDKITAAIEAYRKIGGVCVSECVCACMCVHVCAL